MSELPFFDHIKDPEARALLDMMKFMIQSQQSTIEELVSKIEGLSRLVRGSKPERMPSIESELKKTRSETEEEKQERLRKARETRRKNKEKKKQLETEEVKHDIPEAELKCGHCGDTEFETLSDGSVLACAADMTPRTKVRVCEAT